MNTETRLTVLVDGQPQAVDTGRTLDQLVATLGHASADVATSVNGHFVARTVRAQHVLAEGDSVLLFKPIVGG